MNKRCTKCNLIKDLNNFSKRKLSKDGLDLWCRGCKSEYEKSKNFVPDYDGFKHCTSCGEEKSKTSFHKDHRKSDGLESRCKFCNDKRARKNELSRYYGLTEQKYLDMLNKQERSCAICGAKRSDSLGRKLSVDHCHTTGKVRGLLCTKCNNGIGSFNDNVGLLIRAAKYLENAQDE